MLLSSENAGFKHIAAIVEGYDDGTGLFIGGIKSPKDALTLQGQIIRSLESTPDHPGLLYLRALTEVFSGNTDENIIIESIIASINYGLYRYNLNKKILASLVSYCLSSIAEYSMDLYEKIVSSLLYSDSGELVCESLLANEQLDEDMIYLPALFKIHQITNFNTNLL